MIAKCTGTAPRERLEKPCQQKLSYFTIKLKNELIELLKI